MEELTTVLRYTIAISTFSLSMLVMFRIGAPYWSLEPQESQPDPEPRQVRKPSPPPAKEQEAEDEDKFTCQLADDESATMEWSVNYKQQ